MHPAVPWCRVVGHSKEADGYGGIAHRSVSNTRFQTEAEGTLPDAESVTQPRAPTDAAARVMRRPTHRVRSRRAWGKHRGPWIGGPGARGCDPAAHTRETSDAGGSSM